MNKQKLNKDKINLYFKNGYRLVEIISKILKKRYSIRIELDDLMSSGYIGLLDAIRLYDSTYRNSFKTYASYRIEGEILDYVRSEDSKPRRARDKMKLIDYSTNILRMKLGFKPTSCEVARHMNISLDKYHKFKDIVKPVVLLSTSVFSEFNYEDKNSLLDFASKNNNQIYQVSSKNLNNKLLYHIEKLPKKYIRVMSLYFFEDLNLKEIGKILKISISEVSLMRTKALIFLKDQLLKEGEDFESLCL